MLDRMSLVLVAQQVMGIEPTYSAWKADILPLNYTCSGLFFTQHRYSIINRQKNIDKFVIFFTFILFTMYTISIIMYLYQYS